MAWRGEWQRAVVKRGALCCRVAPIASCQDTERVLKRHQATVGLDRCRPAEAGAARHRGAGAALLGDTAGRPGQEAQGDGGEAGSGGQGLAMLGLGPRGRAAGCLRGWPGLTGSRQRGTQPILEPSVVSRRVL